MIGISNFATSIIGKVDSDTNITRGLRDRVVAKAEKHLSYRTHVWNANIDGTVIQLITNDDHLIDFWTENWFPDRLVGTKPHGTIYAVTGVPGERPFAYYNSETKTAVIFNTNYYGQCKAWALGIAADIMEIQHDVHSIRGSVIDISGCGLCIVAPDGAGRSALAYSLAINIPKARVHSDEWFHVEYHGGKLGRAAVTISERKFYLRTDVAEYLPELRALFSRSKLENVGATFSEVPNSRAILDPRWLGEDKFLPSTRLRAVIILRHDSESPSEQQLDIDAAVNLLREGKCVTTTAQAGGNGESVRTRCEPWYNPFLLVRNEEREEFQNRFFRKLLSFVDCWALNTGAESIDETQKRILRIAQGATDRVLKEIHMVEPVALSTASGKATT